ncbi:nicotinate-nucleotide adenylyltransferase [Chloroflexota bacterium]
MKVGVLGGTFDPIHSGHIMMAEEARARLNLAEVFFVPAGQPWMKADTPISTVEHRVQMVRLAIAEQPYFKLATMEIDRAGPSYTIDTITELQAQLGTGDELFFILGWDSLAKLPQWRDVPRLIKVCHLLAVPRPGYPLPDLNSLEAVLPGLSQGLTLLDKPEVDISAAEIRKRVACGLSIGNLVPKPVAQYIRRNKLYLTQ